MILIARQRKLVLKEIAETLAYIQTILVELMLIVSQRSTGRFAPVLKDGLEMLMIVVSPVRPTMIFAPIMLLAFNLLF